MKSYNSYINEVKSYEKETFRILNILFDIEKANKLISKNPNRFLIDGNPIKIDLNDLSQYFNGLVGINKEYAESIPDDELKIYGMWIEMNDLHFLIDGWHRAYKCWLNGDKTFSAYVIKDPIDIKKIVTYL